MDDKKSYAPPTSANYYPHLQVDHIKDPSKFYAFPILGGLAKFIILIPVFFELIFVGIAAGILLIVNSFIVLLTGKYWNTSYNLSVDISKLGLKVYLFLFGLTNKYPGFNFQIEDKFSVEFPKPKNPNRFFAIPILGGLARIILLVPYLIYAGVLGQGAWIGAVISSFVVIAKGEYPESTYEFSRDAMRVNLGSSVYMYGFTDKYPNFWISMNHQTIKILLIIAGVVAFISSGSSNQNEARYDKVNQYNNAPYQQNLPGQSVPTQKYF